MPDPRQLFDSTGFFKAVEATVKARNLRWKDVADQTGVSTSTLSRMAQGRSPDAPSLVCLAKWAALEPTEFLVSTKMQARKEPRALLATALRNDPRLTTEAAQALEAIFATAYDRLANGQSE